MKLKRITTAMTPEQRKEVKREIEDLTRMITAADEGRKGDVGYFRHSSSFIDPQEVKKSIILKKKRLADGTPKQFTGESANKAFRYAQNLKKWIIDNIPKEQHVRYPKQNESGNDIDNPEKIVSFEQSVEAIIKWQKSKVTLPGFAPIHPVDLYHHIMARIDPDAPREDFNRYMREKV